MSCEHPLLAVNYGKVDGKYVIKILPRDRVDQNILSLEEKYGHDSLMLLPCGSCPSCKEAHKRQWSIRCELESRYWKDSCMITLTYTDERRPKKLIKRDLQRFIKDLRNRGHYFKYFACGEYGRKSGNAHFHIILFGYWPQDAKFQYKTEAGFPLYTSKYIESIWKNGICSISEMAPGTAAYVAGYVDKKIGQDEFILMSKGIGERYFREHLFDLFHYDNIVGSFGVSKIPRYAEKLAEKELYDLDDLKAKRRQASNLALIQSMLAHCFNNKEQAIEFEGRLMRDKLERKRRGL